ncbi:MAG TPA: hypothetical protein VLC52_15650 [Anaerolineae bacterium]|nr:hypothetical protein [Anaerolineae bacterium]
MRLARYEDALVVTEPAPLVDYIFSGTTKLTAGEQRAFTAFVEQEFQQCGNRFYISKESGVFECWPPRAD